MARKTRIHYPGAIYHIVTRGNNREAIFQEADDKTKYLTLIDKYKKKYNFSLYAYALMDNHVHLLGAVDQEPVGKFMQGIQQSYTQYFNRKYKRVGHVFEQRFKAKLCKHDSYILNLLRYIHLNPVKAGITSTPDYRWSSHNSYKKGSVELANSNFLLAFFSDDKVIARKMYIDFLNEVDDSNDEDIEQGYLVKPEITKERDNDVILEIPFDKLLELVSTATGVTSVQILREKYNRQIAEARDILIYTANKAGITKTELSKVLPLSVVGVIKSFNRVLNNERLKDYAEQILRK